MEVLLWPNGAPGALGENNEDRPTLVPYLVPGASPAPAIIVCPGGGYRKRAVHEGEPVALWLNTLGIHAFVVHYRVKPYRHPNPLLDVQRAIRLVRHRAEEWRVDPNRVGLIGFSAGGHAAATAGTHFDGGLEAAADPVDRLSCRPDLLVLCYPVITMSEAYSHQGSRMNLIGEPADEALVRQLSLENSVKEQTPPTFIWHTADDNGVPVENAMLFASALRRAGIPFELHIYESGRHGLGLAADHPEASTWTELCARWLAKQGFRERTGDE